MSDAAGRSPRPSFSEGVARRVLEACRCEDSEARITYVGRDENQRTCVRVRSGGSASVQALQRALQRLMPFAKVRTSEDILDGTVQAEIIVPTEGDEYCLAREDVAGRLGAKLLSTGAFTLAVLAMGMWISAVAQEAANAAAAGI